MNPTVGKAELLERERRWSRRVGIVTMFGALISVISIVVQQPTSGGDTDAEKLADIHDHASAVVIGGVLQGISWVAFAAPLLFLFAAAAGRSDLVRRGFGTFAVIFPVLLLISGIVTAVGLTKAADQFAKEEPRLDRENRQQAKERASAGTT